MTRGTVVAKRLLAIDGEYLACREVGDTGEGAHFKLVPKPGADEALGGIRSSVAAAIDLEIANRDQQWIDGLAWMNRPEADDGGTSIDIRKKILDAFLLWERRKRDAEILEIKT